MRQAPGYLFRDTVQYRKYLQDGPRGRIFGDPETIRCHWEGGQTLVSLEGMRTHQHMATVYVPRWEIEERNYTHTYDQWVTPRRAGNRVGAPATPRPGTGVTTPIGIARLDRITETLTRKAHVFHMEDRIIHNDIKYQIIGLREYNAPGGPDHIVLRVMNQREP